MSEQSLRAALEQKLATTDGWAVSNEFLLGLLAAHPAEPAPVVTDEAAQDLHARVVTEFRRHGQYTLADARAALEAAAPLLGPRPLLDREAVAKRLAGVIHDRHDQMIDGHIEDDADALADAVMELARPMPTREQIEHAVRSAGIGSYSTIVTEALLALLNGAES